MGRSMRREAGSVVVSGCLLFTLAAGVGGCGKKEERQASSVESIGDGKVAATGAAQAPAAKTFSSPESAPPPAAPARAGTLPGDDGKRELSQDDPWDSGKKAGSAAKVPGKAKEQEGGVLAPPAPLATMAPPKPGPQYIDKGAFAGGGVVGGGKGQGLGSGGPAGGADKGPLVAEKPAILEANGRFATTYRPGAGHLAAFDSAVARGIVPDEEREVVSDVGARYSPDFAIPPGKTLFALNELERSKLPPAGGPVHLRVALKSADVAPAARPHLSVHLVLDVSGSMAGASIENARTAAASLVDRLGAGDDFSLVTFSSDAQVLVPDGPVGARRAAIKKTIEGIKEGGGTNIGEGLTLGYREAAKPSIPSDAVKVVLLLSDGRANAGVLDQTRLSTLALNAFQDGVQTSTFGLGQDYDGALMSSIANDGAGGYYYLRDAQQIAPALAAEMDKRLDPVATALEVRVRLRPGVQLLEVYGSRRLNESEEVRVRVQEIAADVQAEKKGIKRDRQDDQKGGMRFFMPSFSRNDAHAILLKLNLPEGVGGREVALVELRYKDRVKKVNVQEELSIKATYGTSDADSAASINGSVARSVQGFAAGESLAQASTLIANGSRETAVALLSEREGILRKMAETMSEPLFLKDADRVARLRTHAGATTGLGDPLVLAMLLETASNTHRR